MEVASMPSATNCAEGGTWQGVGLGLRGRAAARVRLRSARRAAPVSSGREIWWRYRGDIGEI